MEGEVRTVLTAITAVKARDREVKEATKVLKEKKAALAAAKRDLMKKRRRGVSEATVKRALEAESKKRSAAIEAMKQAMDGVDEYNKTVGAAEFKAAMAVLRKAGGADRPIAAFLAEIEEAGAPKCQTEGCHRKGMTICNNLGCCHACEAAFEWTVRPSRWNANYYGTESPGLAIDRMVHNKEGGWSAVGTEVRKIIDQTYLHF